MIETVEQKKARIDESYANPIFNKSDVSWAFEDMKFAKTGKELKRIMSIKLGEYSTKLTETNAFIEKSKATLKKAGFPFSQANEYGYERAEYPDSEKMMVQKNPHYLTLGVQETPKAPISDELYQLRYKYNEALYQCREIGKDLSTLKVLNANLVDDQTYQVSVRQLSMFTKSILDEGHPDYIQKSDDTELEFFEKAAHGKYADNAQNRKRGVVGQEYGKAGEKKEAGEKKMPKLDPEKLSKIARGLSDEELKRTASASKHEHHRAAAHAEMNRRKHEEASQGVPEEKTLDHHVMEQGDGGAEDDAAKQDKKIAEAVTRAATMAGDPGPGSHDKFIDHWQKVVDEAPEEHKEIYQKALDKHKAYKAKHEEKGHKENEKKAAAYDKLKGQIAENKAGNSPKPKSEQERKDAHPEKDKINSIQDMMKKEKEAQAAKKNKALKSDEDELFKSDINELRREEDYEIMKGKSLPVGTIKKRPNGMFIKTASGWKYHSSHSSHQKTEGDEQAAKKAGISVEEYKKLHPGTKKELSKENSSAKDQITKQGIYQGQNRAIQTGSTVKINDDVNLVSFMNIKGKSLKVDSVKKVPMAGGDKVFLIVKDGDKEYEINRDYVSSTKDTSGTKDETVAERQARMKEVSKTVNTSEDHSGETVSVGDHVKIGNLQSDPAKKQGQLGKISSISKDGKTVTVQFGDGKSGMYTDGSFHKQKEKSKTSNHEDVDKAIFKLGEALSKFKTDKAKYSPDAVEVLRSKAKKMATEAGMSDKAFEEAVATSRKAHEDSVGTKKAEAFNILKGE